MNFAPTTTQLYLNKLKQHTSDEAVLADAAALISNLGNLKNSFAQAGISYRLAQPADYILLQPLISVAYNGRYATNSDPKRMTFNETGSDAHIKTAVACSQGVILGTLRLVRERLELFQFFTMPDGWPYQKTGQVPYEFERLAFHPYFDLTHDDELRIQILHGLVQTLTADLDMSKSWLACTMSPNVKAFMDRCGIETREMVQAKLADNEQTRFMLAHWPQYFQNCRPYEIALRSDRINKTENQGENITNIPSAGDEHIWQELITNEWNLSFVRDKLAHPATFYPGRPILMSWEEVASARIFDLSDQHLSVNFAGQTFENVGGKFYTLVESTYAKLKENLSTDKGPVARYLAEQFSVWEHLTDKMNYGFFGFYFTRTGQLEAVVQFPPLPAWKLALNSSPGQLLQDRAYSISWLEARLIFARAHVLVAGASVASATAENLIRDGRIGYLSIGDPKGPNVTNFNRTNYDVLDAASHDTKSVDFARRLHRQDPTQIIYLSADGFHRENLTVWLTGGITGQKVDVVVEAIDTLKDKLAILEIARKENVAVVAVSDVGSIAQLTFQNSDAAKRGESLVFGLGDDKLQAMLSGDFLQVAARMVGLENAVRDEMGLYVRGQKITPFGVAMPQLGSTACVAAGVASEKILRFLLERERHFTFRRLTFDKKNVCARAYHRPSIKECVLSLLFALKSKSAGQNQK